MEIIILESQLRKILMEETYEENIRRKIKFLIGTIGKGELKVNTKTSGLELFFYRPEYKDKDITIQYEIPSVYHFVMNDKKRKKFSIYHFDNDETVDNTLFIPEIIISSKDIDNKNTYSVLKAQVLNHLREKFEKIIDTDIIVHPSLFNKINDKWKVKEDIKSWDL